MRPSLMPVSLVLGLAVFGVACNEPPGGGLISITPEAPSTLDALSLSIDEDAVDPNGHAVTYDIVWTRNGVPETSLDGATEVPADLTARGQVWEVTVTPVDEKEEPGPALTASTTVVNSAPTASVEVTTDQARTGEALSASATTDDVDGDSVDLAWVWLRDGTKTEHTGDSVPEDVTARGETWTVQVTPTDGDLEGEAAEASVTIDNAVPVAVRVELAPEAPTKAGPVTATATGYDDDGDALSWTYTWSVNDVAIPDVDGNELSPDSFEKGATVSVSAVPNDGFADGDPVVSEELVIRNSPPSAEAARITPESVRGDTNVSCELEGWSDLDGDPQGFSVTWKVNGREVGTGATLLASEFGKGDVLQCVVTPDDGTDEGAPVQSTTVTVSNTPPTLASASLSPTAPAEADTITVALGSASDVDGDRITYTYDWSVNGSSIGASSASLTGSDFDRGDTVTVTVTPSDGDDSGASVTSAAVTVVNTAPVVSSVSLSPTTVYTSTPLSASVSASDADGDSLTYRYTWYHQNEGAGSFRALGVTSATLSSTNFDKGDVVYARVTATDGTDVSPPVDSGRLTVANSAPTTPSAVSLSPSSPKDTQALTCATAAASDVDGDALRYRYQWYKDGTLSSTITTTSRSSSLSASSTRAGDKWQCRVASFDGSAYSATRSSPTVTVTGSATGTWTFVDNSSDNVSATALRDFYNTLGTVRTSDYIFVEISGSTSGVNFGAWCSQRADWYVNNYKSKASGSTYDNSGTWTKWHRSQTGSWSSGETSSRRNYWGGSCDANAWSWCSEWGIGGRSIGLMPGNSSNGETYVSGFSAGRGWRATVKVGASRAAACGF